ncbi:MAG: BrnT family toxin [Rickettsiales bacterium]
MKITYDENKREITLKERNLDFEESIEVFTGAVYELEDTRKNYGEKRIMCFGLLKGRMVVVGYVQRGNSRHIFSLRKANEKEQKRFRQRLS